MPDGSTRTTTTPQKVLLIVSANDDPVVIYVITSDMVSEIHPNYGEITEYIGKYKVLANSQETLELQLPEDSNGLGDNCGFCFYNEVGYATITYRQTQPAVEDHFFYPRAIPTFLIVLLVNGLGKIHYLRWVDTRDLEEIGKSIQIPSFDTL